MAKMKRVHILVPFPPISMFIEIVRDVLFVLRYYDSLYFSLFFFISFSPAYTLTPLLFDSILFIVVQNGGNVIGKVNATGNCAVCLRWIKPIEAAHTNEPEEWAMRERFGHRKMRWGRKKSDHHRGNIQILCLSISHHFSVMNFRRCPNDR